MGTEMNHVRAMRLAEIVQEFRDLQHYIHQIRFSPPPDESAANEEGYVLLQRCMTEGQAVLAQPFDESAPAPQGDAEKERTQLRRVILDASVRRFQAQRIYLRATAAMRWINSRSAIAREQKGNGRSKAMKAVNDTLHAELDAITDERVMQDLRDNDEQQGKWLDEDPSLATIQRILRDQA